MLNEHQKKKVSITMESLEEELLNIEQHLKGDDYVGALYELKNDVPLPIRKMLMTEITSIKEKIGNLADRFSLDSTGPKRLSQEIIGVLSILWVSLDEIKAKRLRAYGEVDGGLEEALDPELELMIQQILTMHHVVDEIRQKG